MSVDHDVWTKGHALATVRVDASVTYTSMNRLCEALHAAEPRVRFDNRQWLHEHIILYLGAHDLALAALKAAVAVDTRKWTFYGPGAVSLPQLCSRSRQDANPAPAADDDN